MNSLKIRDNMATLSFWSNKEKEEQKIVTKLETKENLTYEWIQNGFSCAVFTLFYSPGAV